jgi:hypothetical protein
LKVPIAILCFVVTSALNIEAARAEGRMRGLGIVAKLARSREEDDRQLALIQGLGVDTVVFTPGEWAGNERAKGQYAFDAETRYVLERLRSAHIHPVVLLFRKNGIYSNPLDPDAFARYCSWVARSLKGSVAAYQIWNEPSNFDVREHYGGAWNGRDNARWVSEFSDLMASAAKAVREAYPSATILVSLEGPPLVYALRDHRNEFANIDGVSLHPYPGQQPPEQVPWGGVVNAVRDGVSVADDQGSLASMINIEAITDPKKYLGRPLQAWITEYGFPTCSLDSKPAQYKCVAPDVQASYHIRGLVLGLAQGVKLWAPYELVDEGNNPSDPENNFGLVRNSAAGYAIKPAFSSIQRVARILGEDWRYLPVAPFRVSLRDGTSATSEWISNQSSSVSGPQIFWFDTNTALCGFMWEAGYYDTSRSALAFVHLPIGRRAQPTVVDLISGITTSPAIETIGNQSSEISVYLSSRPVVVQIPHIGKSQAQLQSSTASEISASSFNISQTLSP